MNNNYSDCLRYLREASAVQPGNEQLQRRVADVARLEKGVP
jgi:hypothetical protein